MKPQVKLEYNDKNGLFYIRDNADVIAEMSFIFADDKMIIDHTHVLPGYKEKGLGKSMVAECVDFARKNNYKILPLCSFAKHIMDKTPDYYDVL